MTARGGRKELYLSLILCIRNCLLKFYTMKIFFFFLKNIFKYTYRYVARNHRFFLQIYIAYYCKKILHNCMIAKLYIKIFNIFCFINHSTNFSLLVLAPLKYSLCNFSCIAANNYNFLIKFCSLTFLLRLFDSSS
jgi:hypothetical protein